MMRDPLPADRAVLDMALQRTAALDHLLLGEAAPAENALVLWARELLEGISGSGLGIAADGIDPTWRAALRWAGLPLARGPGATARWARDVLPGPRGLRLPTVDGERLLLPAPAQLHRCTGVDLLGLRAWSASRWKLRLQAGPRVAIWQWPTAAVLLNGESLAVGGFLHGPHPGQRLALHLEAGECQVHELHGP